MFKKIGILTLILCAIVLSQSKSHAFWFKKNPEPAKEVSFAPINYANGNKIWVGTFQLVWNDLMHYVTKGPVVFANEPSPLADALNKKGFTSSMISKNSYYKKHGKMTPALKQEIETNLKKKLNETSDILNDMDWNSGGILLYAMLKKDFEFLKEFKDLGPGLFEGEGVKFFGIPSDGNDELRQNVEVLFHNSSNDFAVKLYTKENEELILYRTDEEGTFENYYNDLNQKIAEYEGETEFQSGDLLKVPYIKFDQMFTYNELTNKPIKNTDYVINGALQTVKFKLDNKGGTLKSEAALIMRMSLRPTEVERDFSFNKPFILFLKEKGQSMPYFMVEFTNPDLFEKI